MAGQGDSGKRAGPAAGPTERPIALVGMMGAGKSAVGRALAARLGRTFADTDALIEVEAGRTVAEIFAREGEAAFRGYERRLIERLTSFRRHVLALGGGMFVGEENVARIGAAAATIWLRARVDTLVARLGPRAGEDRPLLRPGDPAERLAALLAERAPWYGRAQLALDTDGLEVEEVAAAITRALAEPGSGAARPCG